MKVTIACKYFSPRGGAQTFLINFARCLVADGHSVKVVTMEAGAAVEGVATRIVRPRGVPRTLRDFLFARATLRALDGDDSDLIFGEQRTWGADVVRPGGGVHREHLREVVKSYPSAAVRVVRRVTKRLSLKEYLTCLVERRLYLKHTPRLVIANSDMLRRQLVAHYPALADRIALVYNGTDCERFNPGLRSHRARVRAELSIPEDAIAGAFVSFDFRRKGLPTLLRSLAMLKRKPSRREVFAIVVGRRKAWAQRLAGRLGVEDRVRFVGPRAPDPYYGACDLLLLPSYFDPCANVTLEGLACGLPAITSAHNGAHELLTPGRDGFYVRDSGDAAQFAGFIEHFMEPDVIARASEAARALALEHTLRRQYDEIVAAITPVAEQKARRRGRGSG